MRRRIGLLISFALFSAAFLSVGANLAMAAMPTADTSGPAYVGSSYSGWGYVAKTVTSADSASDVIAWRWTSTGWVSADLGSGSSVRVYPFGSGWSWGYRNGNWYAIHTANVAKWSCSGSGMAMTIAVRLPNGQSELGAPDTRVFKYNSSKAPVVGNVARGSSVQILCDNSFPSAFDARYQSSSYTLYADETGGLFCGFVGYHGGAAPMDHSCMHIEEPFVLVRAVVNGASTTAYLHVQTGFESPIACCPP